MSQLVKLSLSMFRFFLFLSLVLVAPIFAEDRPNFVIIFIDDMGYGDIGPFGSTDNRTPNLDRMAEEGMKLTSFYAAPVCSASRAQLLTGSYAPRVSVPGVFFPKGNKGLNPAEHTIADYLSEAGYATGCFGKWHLGDQVEFLPTRQGFDTYFGIPYSNDMGRVATESGLKVHPLMRDEQVAELLEDEGQRRITREYTEETIQFIEANQDKPFFVYLPHTAMHVPIFPHPDFAGKSSNGIYGDWVEEVDWSVGQVLDTLTELGLDKKTLVIFTSDNGPWASKGEKGGVSGPLRGSKGGTLEGGVREPTIAWWPGKIAANSSIDAISGTTDFLPTFASLAGVELNPDIKIDGKDLSPLLKGETKESPHEAWHYYKGTKLMAVRSGPWKLALEPQSIGMGFNKQPGDTRTSGRLYNLDDDIGETTDVAAVNPEIVRRLRKIADAMIADIGSGQAGPGVRPAGLVENPVMLYPSTAHSKSRKAVAPAKPVNWKKVSMGDTVDTGQVPPVAGQPISIRATVEADKPHGVVVSHGGSNVGYVFYFDRGRPVFMVKPGKGVENRISSKSTFSGEVDIVANVNSDGTIAFTINGDSKTTGKSQLLKSHPQEHLNIGFDAANRVDKKAPAGDFNGQIHQAEVTTGDKK